MDVRRWRWRWWKCFELVWKLRPGWRQRGRLRYTFQHWPCRGVVVDRWLGSSRLGRRFAISCLNSFFLHRYRSTHLQSIIHSPSLFQQHVLTPICLSTLLKPIDYYISLWELSTYIIRVFKLIRFQFVDSMLFGQFFRAEIAQPRPPPLEKLARVPLPELRWCFSKEQRCQRDWSQ